MSPAERSAETDDLVGVLPAAGWARRSAPLPCSKEIFPVGFHAPAAGRLPGPQEPPAPDQAGAPAATRPKPACGYLLEAMRLAGARRAVVGLRPGKWDVPACLGDGAAYGLALAYTVLTDSPGVPWTVRRALDFAAGARVLLGFPDIVFRPADALARVERRQRERGADVVLGLFPARRPEKMDMVAVDADGRVRDIVIKPESTQLVHTWILAAWTPTFTGFLDAFLRELDSGGRVADDEVHVGDVVRTALSDGWRVDAVDIPEGVYRDIGTPDELAEAVREFS